MGWLSVLPGSPLFLSRSTRVLISRILVLGGFELGSVAWDATGGQITPQLRALLRG